MHYDIFNGDADGICALHQLRLHTPLQNRILVTGVKRDIKLLQQLEDCTDSSLTVLDISLDSNRQSLQVILQDQTNKVIYIDHHFAGEIPKATNLSCHINIAAETCTSLIVNELLNSRYILWAICGGFGDNLHKIALKLCKQEQLSQKQVTELREVGELLNYNGYGAELDDLHFHPESLYKAVMPYASPFDFYHQAKELTILKQGYISDMEQALALTEFSTEGKNRVYRFPNAPWARRISGVFSNLKAREKQDCGHALITENKDRSLRISVRAPLNDRRDADTLCKEFPTGGGRAAAAGINQLPPEMLDHFLRRFAEIYK